MKLVFFRGKVPNFGDELNLHVWPALLPKGFLDEDESELFVGIGSIIGTQMDPKARKFVMGSGYAGYMGLPDINDGTWDIRFVRGPNTAKTLGIDPKLSICDSAILLRAMDLPEERRRRREALRGEERLGLRGEDLRCVAEGGDAGELARGEEMREPRALEQ